MLNIIQRIQREREIKVEHSSAAVASLINFLQGSAKDIIKKSYTIEVAAVTEAMIETAQEIINRPIAIDGEKRLDKNKTNETLLELYRVIPRKMNHTKNFLLQDDSKKEFFKELLKKKSKMA